MDVSRIIEQAPDYIIMRMSPEFPKVERGRDIDLLVKDIEAWVFYLKYMVKDLPGQVVAYPLTPDHYQVDYYDKGFYLKWDLYKHYISFRYVDDTWKTKRIIQDRFIVPSVRMDRISKCYECIHHGKSKYAEYEKYKDQLHEYAN